MSLSTGVGATKCFLTSSGARLYFYSPIFVLLIANSVVYLMTILNLWRSDRENEIAVLSRISRTRNEVRVPLTTAGKTTIGKLSVRQESPLVKYAITINPFFKYYCQPRGYISEGERTIDNQSEQAATLHMITIRVILPQFTMIGRNRHRMGTRILHSSLLRD